MPKSLKYECLKPKYNMQVYDRFTQKKFLPVTVKEEVSALQIIAPQLVEQFFAGTYKWSVPEKVLINKSGTNKKRIVYMYSMQDRYLMVILYRAFSAYFDDTRNEHCFSYATGVSTQTAIKYLRNNIEEDLCGVKIDIHAYFNSVSKKRLQEMINTLFKGNVKAELESLFLDDRCTFRGEEIHEYKALIAGSPLASFFANYCLKELDDELDKRGILFARYSDDIIILGKNKVELEDALKFVIDKISEYELEINPDKYKWFEKGENFDFLGLSLSTDGVIDVSKHSLMKMKKEIHRWCKKGRKEMEMYKYDFFTTAKSIMDRWNYKNFKCFIEKSSTFGWCHYAFRYITTDKSLIILDKYVKDTIRAMKTGRHNKRNKFCMTEEEFQAIGWVSLVDLYKLYKQDFDYYCEIIDLM